MVFDGLTGKPRQLLRRRQGVQLPALVAVLAAIGIESLVALLRRIGRRLEGYYRVPLAVGKLALNGVTGPALLVQRGLRRYPQLGSIGALERQALQHEGLDAGCRDPHAEAVISHWGFDPLSGLQG